MVSAIPDSGYFVTAKSRILKHRNNSKNNNGAGAMKRNCSMFIFVLAGLLCSPVSHAEKDYDDLSREEMKAIADKAQKGSEAEDADGWQSEKVAVDDKVISGQWNSVPFQTRFFDYPPEKLKEAWPVLMRALRIPYPSAEYLERRIEHFPQLKAELGPEFDGNYQHLSDEILEAWRFFFRGDFRAAKEHGSRLGAYGKIPAYLAQSVYAVYLTDTREEKLQLLQDVANQITDYLDLIKSLKDEEEFQADYMTLRLGYAFSIARIAEEASPVESLMNNYLFKVSRAIDDTLEIEPNHPVALAMNAAKDANIIRYVGKLFGRLTFGARLSRVEDYFEQAFEQADDLAIVHYEYANSLIYINRNPDIYRAMEEFNVAIGIHPKSAMEALDSMYASKRLREIKDYYLNFRKSYRSFERERREYMLTTDENLYSVLKPPFLVSEYLKRKDAGTELSQVH